jgi:hypothetical protein
MPYSFARVVLPETGKRSTPNSPETKLMWAVLARAVKDIARDNVSTLDRDSAIHWIFNEENHYIFSFETLCLHLDIDPAHFRAKIRKL